MKICIIIRPNSTKIVAELDNYDLTTSAMVLVSDLMAQGKIPINVDKTEVWRDSFRTDNYPIEKLKEFIRVATSEDNFAIGELENLHIVAQSLANLMEKTIGELEGAPLETNVNMDSWLDKPLGYYKEIDDIGGKL